MKKKIQILAGVAFLLATTLAGAQSLTLASEPINGSPYLDDEYISGAICFATMKYSVPLRYNAFRDQVEYKQGGNSMVVDPNGTVKRVVIGKSTLLPLLYESGGKSKYGYFTMLDSGKVCLFVKKKIVFVAAKKGVAVDGSDQPAEYRKSPDTFYFRIGDGQLQEVQNIKSLIASMPDKQEELATFAKKEKISPRKEKELVQFVQYYNSL